MFCPVPRQSLGMTSTQDSTKEVLHARLTARSQQSLGNLPHSASQGSLPQSTVHSSQSTLAQLQQQLALSRKQQQQQQQQQLQMQSHQYDLAQQERQLQMTSQSQQQSLRMMQSQAPPNVFH